MLIKNLSATFLLPPSLKITANVSWFTAELYQTFQEQITLYYFYRTEEREGYQTYFMMLL